MFWQPGIVLNTWINGWNHLLGLISSWRWSFLGQLFFFSFSNAARCGRQWERGEKVARLMKPKQVLFARHCKMSGSHSLSRQRHFILTRARLSTDMYLLLLFFLLYICVICTPPVPACSKEPIQYRWQAAISLWRGKLAASRHAGSPCYRVGVWVCWGTMRATSCWNWSIFQLLSSSAVVRFAKMQHLFPETQVFLTVSVWWTDRAQPHAMVYRYLHQLTSLVVVLMQL